MIAPKKSREKELSRDDICSMMDSAVSNEAQRADLVLDPEGA